MELELVAGWSSPIRFLLKIDGVMATSFSSQDVAELVLKTGDGHSINTTGDIALTTTSTSHNCVYTPDSGDLIMSKTPYLARFKVTDGLGRVQFFPNIKADRWIVHSA